MSAPTRSATQLFVANAGDGEIVTHRLGPDGTLETLATSPVGPGNTALALDDAHDRMFCSVRGDQPTIATLDVRPDGTLVPVASTAVDASVTYLALDSTGSTVIAVSYDGGFGVTLPVGPDGSLGAPTSRVAHANLHSVAVSPDDAHVYLASLGEDLIAQYRFVDQALQPLDPPTVAAPAGSGPRHQRFSGDGRTLYCVTEFSGEAVRFTRDPATGQLTRHEAVPGFDPSAGLAHSRYGADPAAEHLIWGADLHLTADERFLFCSERCASTLVAVEVAGDGRLGAQASVTPTEDQPRGFAVVGDLLVAVGEKSPWVSVYRIGADAALTRTAREPGGTKANWVVARTV